MCFVSVNHIRNVVLLSLFDNSNQTSKINNPVANTVVILDDCISTMVHFCQKLNLCLHPMATLIWIWHSFRKFQKIWIPGQLCVPCVKSPRCSAVSSSLWDLWINCVCLSYGLQSIVSGRWWLICGMLILVKKKRKKVWVWSQKPHCLVWLIILKVFSKEEMLSFIASLEF